MVKSLRAVILWGIKLPSAQLFLSALLLLEAVDLSLSLFPSPSNTYFKNFFRNVLYISEAAFTLPSDSSMKQVCFSAWISFQYFALLKNG